MSKGQIDTRKNRTYHRTTKRKAKVKEYNASPRGRYQAHKLNAKTRGIEFLFTFKEWFEIWRPHWRERGRGRGKYHMCRYNDKGPYSAENIYIAKHEQNARDMKRVVTDEQINRMIALRALDVSYRIIGEIVKCSGSLVRYYVNKE